MTIDLELAVQDLDGVLTARAVGATRVELCAALGATGGITPSLGTIRVAVETGLPVHVLVRPRPGSFVYTEDEAAVAEADIEAALRAGAAGVVVGALTPHGTIDARALARFVAAARDAAPHAEVTFHRAIDTAIAGGNDPEGLLETLGHAGVDRILTSGGATDWRHGLPVLRRLVAAAHSHVDRVEVMAGGGVRLGDLPTLLDAGVDAVHVSAKQSVNPSGVRAAPGQGLPDYESTDRVLAGRIAAALPLRTRA
ncbi:copper homeostasis protein CutC [Sinomonas sp. ASV322]|uniref:copper homeostasis protein CutC n=1 Tax=Sinomonas sp. ASV322 TaxID=3041920 RepID=UPI0027DD61DC|nr:copper homeostasis protein CutC [Sinomonas sp. ASV322]MDQ4504364.1 copper homeostasis protein CutC [Sinomonas sp. ASV322]